MTLAHNDKVNINSLKSLNANEYDNMSYNSKANKAAYLHGRKPKKIRFFVNGDKFFQGKKISVHAHKYQTIEELQTELTNKMPPQVYLPNGIRQIFSPSSGLRITEVDQLENERDYVCAGNEAFKGIAYGQNPREPWFKGRPQHLSRYPQLIPIGLGSIQSLSQNLDSNNFQKLDGQSNYAVQNAFPTRFYRPAGPAYLSKNIISHFGSNGSSIAYQKLIKFRSKGTDSQGSSYYKDLLTQQVKPKVITVVKGGPESPKSFVRILLNKRSVQSYEALVTDIETSLRTQNQQKISGIVRIYNLFGKEIKSVADFFKSNDFFIAIGDQDHLGIKEVKEILDEMYPDHPQTDQILQYWRVKKFEASADKENIRDQDKIQNFQSSNISVDKRDSGFEEQDFSKESDLISNTNSLVDKESNSLPKPKISTNKPTIRKKKTSTKNKLMANSILKAMESDSTDVEKSPSRYSPTTYRKLMQERNAERLHAAYEDREKARMQIQEQLKTERKRIEDYALNNNSVYSQYVRKSINEKGSIDVFKKMDEASLESRKQKMRQKLEKHGQQMNEYSTHTEGSSSSYFSRDKRENEELPHIDHTLSTTHKNPEETNQHHTELLSSNHQKSPPVLRKLNKIAEAPNESNLEELSPPAIERRDKHKETDKPKKKGNKSRRSSQDIQLSKNKKVKEASEDVQAQAQPSQPKESISQQDNVDTNANSSVENEKKIPDEHVGITKEISKATSIIKTDIPLKSLMDPSPTKTETNIDQKQSSQFVQEDLNPPPLPQDPKQDILMIKEIPESVNQILPQQEIQNENKDLNEKLNSPIAKKVIQRQLSFPGNRVMGKLCRQISSPQIVYQRFETSKVLGDGNFAIVKMAIRKESKHEYALKIIDKSKMRGKESMIENEIWIMKLCNHENIIKLKEEYESREEVFLVMELVKGGDLFDAITQSVKFSEPIAAKMVIDMTNALFYLHSRQVVHRDLKPENLMVLRHRDGSITLKLADFGLAMEVKKLIFTVCGTPTYVAPEILTEKGYSLEVDLWALGVITYILLCGFPPFRSPKKDQDQLFEFIKSGNFEFISPYWDKISYDVKDLISKLLVVDRRQRYTSIQVLSHKWILSKGSSVPVSEEMRRGRSSQLEEEAKLNLEDFQRKKKELRQAINREIQAAYSSQNK